MRPIADLSMLRALSPRRAAAGTKPKTEGAKPPTDAQATGQAEFPSTALPGPGERKLALWVALVSAVAFVVAVPYAREPLAQVWAFIPIYEVRARHQRPDHGSPPRGAIPDPARPTPAPARVRLFAHGRDGGRAPAHLSGAVLDHRVAGCGPPEYGLALRALAQRLPCRHHRLRSLEGRRQARRGARRPGCTRPHVRRHWSHLPRRLRSRCWRLGVRRSCRRSCRVTATPRQ